MLQSEPEPKRLFAGGTRQVSVVWRNQGSTALEVPLFTRLYQASSATAAPVDRSRWGTLRMLPGQTVIECVALALPDVTAETRFLIQWLNQSNTVLGITDILAYPTNLLRELSALGGHQPVGVLDPHSRLVPLLTASGLDLWDFQEQGFAGFPGKLAILGPFESKLEIPPTLRSSVQLLARKGAGVVWILPPADEHAEVVPSFSTVLEGEGAILLVQPALLAKLAEDPRAQLHLVQLCRRAVKPRPVQLPFLSADP